MSLLDEMKALEPGWNGVNAYTVEDEIDNVEKVSDEHLDSRRWVEVWEAVFRRGEGPNAEYVALRYEVPATEMQEGGDFNHEVYEVKPVQVTVWKYVKV